MMDPESMSSIEISAEYEQAALSETSTGYVELPLMVLREQYKSPSGKVFLDKIIATQQGKPHPQDRHCLAHE